MPMEEAALYELPFEYVIQHVPPIVAEPRGPMLKVVAVR